MPGQHIGPVLRVARRRKQIALWLFQVAKRHPLHAGVARRAGAAQEDSSDPKPVRIVCRLPPGQQWPGLGDTCIGLERWACWLSGPARSRGGGGPSEKATSQLGLAQVVAEADRVLEDNGTVEKIKAVLRRWSSTWVGVFKSGERFELRKSAEDKPREVDPFREERRVEAKTARVRGRGRTACFV